MAIGLISHVSVAAASTTTSSAIDTTGATLLVANMANYEPAGVPTLSDSKSNTWTQLTLRVVTGDVEGRLYYVENPVVGSSHTFTFTGTLVYTALCVAAFNATLISAVYDSNETGTSNSSTATSIQPGSVTPSQDNCVICTGMGAGGATSITVDSGFTITDVVNYSNGVNFAGGLAYLVETAPVAKNPTWSWTTAGKCYAVTGVFKGLFPSAEGLPMFGKQVGRMVENLPSMIPISM